MGQVMTAVELLINILGTLLLGSSNNCAQLLSAPERKDIDKAHHAGTWLELGVPSLRNLWYVHKWRGALCFALLASSIPIHLLYNSAVLLESVSRPTFAAIATHEFNVTVVPQVTIPASSTTITFEGPFPAISYQDMSSFDLGQNGTLKQVGNRQCLAEYNSIQAGTGLSNLVMVTNATQQGLLVMSANKYWAGTTLNSSFGWPFWHAKNWSMSGIPDITVSYEIYWNTISKATALYGATVEADLSKTSNAFIQSSGRPLAGSCVGFSVSVYASLFGLPVLRSRCSRPRMDIKPLAHCLKTCSFQFSQTSLSSTRPS